MRIAVCSAFQDKQYLERLEDQLSALVARGQILLWHSGKIDPGADFSKEVNRNLEQADIIVLLISADLLASADPMVRLALAQQARGAKIIPVMLRATYLADEHLAAMKRLPTDGNPLSPRIDEDQAWVEVVNALMEQATPSAGTNRERAQPPQPVADRTEMSAAGAPLRLLFLGAAPSDATRLQLDREVREIGQRIDYAQQRKHIHLEQQWAVTAQELSQLLLRYRPNILHFSGHGTADGRLVLVDGQGRSSPVPRVALAQLFALFKKKGLRCVVLNACFAEEQARTIAEHIEFVVGISGAIADESSLSFAAGLYTGLAAGETMEDAFQLGCIQIGLMDQTQADAPRLLCRSGVDAATTRLL